MGLKLELGWDWSCNSDWARASSKCKASAGNKTKQNKQNNKRNKRTTHTKSIPVRHMRIEIQMRIQIQFRFKSVKGNTDKRQAAGGKRDMLTVPACRTTQHTTHNTQHCQQKLARASTMFGQPLTSSLFFGHIIKIDCRIVAPSCGRPGSVRPSRRRVFSIAISTVTA